MQRINIQKISLAMLLVTLLSSCSRTSDNELPRLFWSEDVYQDASRFAGQCRADYQKYFLRSVFNRFYYWYQDIVDADPASFNSIGEYFDELVSDEITPSLKPRDAYSTFVSSNDYADLVSGDRERGYGIRYTTSEPGFEGEVYAGYVVPGSPAALAGIQRGDRISSVDGFSFEEPDREFSLPALFPRSVGESHDFQIVGTGTVALISADVNFDPVQYAQILPGTDIGYLFFDDHALDAEGELIEAFDTFAAHSAGNGIDDLILDLRYNSGGLLFIASQVAYMIAGEAQTSNKIFEELRYNDRFFAEDFEFIRTGRHPPGNTEAPLPTVSLNRVVVISDHATCSASESIINALRGIGVEVILVGERSCGKPYGFIGFDNCGTTWLPVEFQSFNNAGESDYADGFFAGAGTFGVSLPGCTVADDFSSALGDITEARIAAAVQYLDSSTCPAALISSNSASVATATVSAASTATRSYQPVRNHTGSAMLRALQGTRILAEREDVKPLDAAGED
ncbi:MAG: S41 family peptidase [Pseudomonadales bacterium]